MTVTGFFKELLNVKGFMTHYAQAFAVTEEENIQMQWTEDMSVGIPMIDRGHRELISRLPRSKTHSSFNILANPEAAARYRPNADTPHYSMRITTRQSNIILRPCPMANG
jgi:hypothetical protein